MATQRSSTVVVGCDGSWHSHRAVVTATWEAVRRDADLTVLVVPAPHEPRSDRLGEVLRSEEEALASARATAERGVSWALETDPTVRARAMVSTAGAPELDALLGGTELLVLGGHGRGGQRAFSLGTTSLWLAHSVRGPLLLSAPDGPLHPAGLAAVVVGLDSQPSSLHALSHAAYLAATRGAELVVVSAVLPRQAHVVAAVARAAQDASAALESLEAPLTRITVKVTAALVVDALLEACAPGALLVLGNRGVGRVQGPVPGSLTQRVMERATCDLALVPLPVPPPVDGILGAAASADAQDAPSADAHAAR
ncbi:universal stress protein [Pedococcus bigeumensis]|uniref:universal stress protein n=1 Tax=Pedococcus bigeumensis TaxID=433644 RepID=UPI002FEA6F2D